MADEHPLLVKLRLLASSRGARLFRNNVGTGWIGKMRRLPTGDMHLKAPRPLHAGLCKGSSDLIGWRTVTITPDMVGQKFARFLAVEVKTPGVELTEEQAAFIKAVNDQGGLAAEIRSEEELEQLLK